MLSAMALAVVCGNLVDSQHQGLAQVLAPLCQALPGNPTAAFLPPGSPLPGGCSAGGGVAGSCYGNAIEEKMCAERGLCFAGFRDENIAVAGQANDGNCWYYCKGVSGHAGLFGPVDALVGMGQFYLQSVGGVFNTAMQNTGAGRGLGFEVDEKFPEGCGHTGFTGGSLWVSHTNKIGVAILANRLAYRGREPKNLNAFRRWVHGQVLAGAGALGAGGHGEEGGL